MSTLGGTDYAYSESTEINPGEGLTFMTATNKTVIQRLMTSAVRGSPARTMGNAYIVV